MTVDVFEAHRPRLLGVAYGILGEIAEAEDVVQDAWLRWRSADRAEVRNAEAFLVTTTTRIAIDRLRSARARRERYVGTWLPDPLVVEDASDPETATIEAEELRIALLCALERLNPVERAVLVLRDAFDLEYASIADALDRSPAGVRQIAKRARDRIGDASRRRPVDRDEQQRLSAAFLLAIHHGQFDRLRDLLAVDAIQYSDGGGHGHVARTPVEGSARIVRLYRGVDRTGAMPRDLVPQPVRVNGEFGLRLVSPTSGPYAITLLEVAGDRIVAIRNFANPERFSHL